MTTGVTLLDRSLRMLGVLASGGTSDTNQRADGLVALNGLLESWRNDRLLVPSLLDSSLTLVNAQQSYTIGVSGDLNITRPTSFEDAYVTQVSSSTDSKVRLISQSEWDEIPAKTVTSPIPTKAFYNPTMTISQGTLKVYPIPTTANILHLISWTVLASLTAITDTVLLPPGYDRAIAANLAIELAPEYQVEPSQATVRIASGGLKMIRRMNITPIPAVSDLAGMMPSNRRVSNIMVGP